MSRRKQRDEFLAQDDDELLYDSEGGMSLEEDESDIDQPMSDQERISHRPRRTNAGQHNSRYNDTASSGQKKKSYKGKGKAWEGQFERTWDQVQEDERGTLEGAVSDILLTSKTRRILRDTSSIQRGIIRHVYLVIDLSSAMLVRDYKQTWLDLTLQYASDFVTEFFDQNPIGQMALMITRDGLAERLTPLSGNPADHLKALSNKKKLETRGAPSLQNVLQLAKTGLSHLPPHGSREVIIILGSLTSCDPTNIHQTITDIENERIRVNIIGLSADMKICRDISEQTKGTYRVARDDLHFRDLLFEFVSPPPTLAPPSKSHLLGGPSPLPPTSSSDLMQMGFPTLSYSLYPSVCGCHGKLKSGGGSGGGGSGGFYGCPRCKMRICDVPTECRVCGLTVVNAPQLARSYRHLFPVENYERVLETTPTSPSSCFSCSYPFTPHSTSHITTTTAQQLGDLSPLGRYRCRACRESFCLECDKLVHDALGFCPGCCGDGKKE